MARVRICEGTGQFQVNGLNANTYFPLEVQQTDIRAPLKATEMGERVDVIVNVNGSSKPSQSGAVMQGLARALKEFRPDLDPALRDGGFLTRDARMVEAQEVRPQESPQELPVLQALIAKPMPASFRHSAFVKANTATGRKQALRNP